MSPRAAVRLLRGRHRTLKLTVAYDGTRYAGWQIQDRRRQMSDVRRQTSTRQRGTATIQGTLERVLGTILRERVRVIGSGRTDAGVHALAQVAHLRTRSSVPTPRLLRSVNALLPEAIAVTDLQEAAPAFHARFGATRKRYRYRMFTGCAPSPFIRPYVHHVRGALSVSAMRREAAALCGRHDFRAFARSGPRLGDTRRTITVARLSRAGPELRFDVEGSGFLHAMVRSMVGTLVDVGRGRRPAGTVRRMLRTGRRELAGTTAPAKGLTLVHVEYPRGSARPGG